MYMYIIFSWHFENNKVYMGLITPMMIMTGQYNISGNVFQLPVKGDGDFITMLGKNTFICLLSQYDILAITIMRMERKEENIKTIKLKFVDNKYTY